MYNSSVKNVQWRARVEDRFGGYGRGWVDSRINGRVESMVNGRIETM